MPVNEPTLAIADSANGGAGIATVTGSTVGATNTLYGQPYDPAFAIRPWRSLGSVVSSGSISFSVPLGHWAFYVKSVLAGESEVSRIHYGGITDAARQSVQLQCLEAAAVRVKAAGLQGLANKSVVVQELPWSRLFEGDNPRLPLPGIVVCLAGAERIQIASNVRDDIFYPVLIAIVARNNQELGTYLPRYTLWRQTLERAFRSGRMPGVQSVIAMTVEPGTIVVPDPFINQLWHSAFVVRCQSREPRGLGA